MKNLKKIVLLITFIVSLTFYAYSAYSASTTVQTYIIDAETCVNCSYCYEQHPETFDVFNEYATWQRLGASFKGLLFLYYPTTDEITDIEDAMSHCPTESIFPG